MKLTAEMVECHQPEVFAAFSSIYPNGAIIDQTSIHKFADLMINPYLYYKYWFNDAEINILIKFGDESHTNYWKPRTRQADTIKNNDTQKMVKRAINKYYYRQGWLKILEIISNKKEEIPF